MTRILYVFLCAISAAACWAQEIEQPLFNYANESSIRSMAFSPDGDTFIFCEYLSGIKVVSFDNDNSVTAIEEPYTSSLLYRSDEEFISADFRTITFWNARTFEKNRTFDANGEFPDTGCGIQGILLFPDGETIAVKGDSYFMFWDLQKGVIFRPCNRIDFGFYRVGWSGSNHQIQFAKDPLRILSRGTNSIRVWEKNGLAFEMREIEFSGEVIDYLLFEDRGILKAALEDNRILTCDLETGGVLEERAIENEKQLWGPGALSSDGQLFYSNKMIWDVESGRRIVSLLQDRTLLNAIFSPDKTKIAFHTIDGVEVWDISSLQQSTEVEDFTMH